MCVRVGIAVIQLPDALGREPIIECMADRFGAGPKTTGDESVELLDHLIRNDYGYLHD